MGASEKYRGKAVFLGQTVDDIPFRTARWWAAKYADVPDAEGAVLPLALVDSGFRYTGGRVPFEATYGQMIDAALDQPPLVEIDAYQQRVGASYDLRVFGQIRNVSQHTLGYDNFAALSLLAYEPIRVLHVDWYVRGGLEVPLEEDLAPGATMSFDHTIADLPPGTRMTRVQGLVQFDYRPDPRGPFVSAQAALAVPGTPPPVTPTATREATPTPTEAPGASARAYLPALRRPAR